VTNADADRPPRRLFVLRHAHAVDTAAGTPSGVDHDRALDARGRAALAGVALAITRALPPFERLDAVLGSTARRVAETIDGVLEAVPAAPPELSRARYLAGSDALLDDLRDVDDAVRTVLVCGHNPGTHQLVLELAGRSGGRTLRSRVEQRFPTAALAVLDVAGPWRRLAPGGGTLVGFHIPKDD
jgi:phosphohistidine phosphatase